MMTLLQPANLPANDSGRDVAQPSPAASSRTVPVRESGSHDALDPDSGGGTPPKLAAGTAAVHDEPNQLASGFHFRGVLPHLKKEAAKRPLTWHEQEELFRWYSIRVDKYLDAGHGECHLRRLEFADLVAGAICFFERQRYELRAWVVMPNHAHVVVWPMPGHTLSDILHSWKSYTAHEINKLLPKRIVPFWQSESYEHLIRDDEDMRRCCHYTLMNPVTACLCARPEDWKWSSAHVSQPSVGVAQPSPAASSRTVPVRELESNDPSDSHSGGGTPPEPAGGDACATPPSP